MASPSMIADLQRRLAAARTMRFFVLLVRGGSCARADMNAEDVTATTSEESLALLHSLSVMPGVRSRASTYLGNSACGCDRRLGPGLMLNMRQFAQSASEIEVVPELGSDHAAEAEAREGAELAFALRQHCAIPLH